MISQVHSSVKTHQVHLKWVHFIACKTYHIKVDLKKEGFPGGAVVESLPANAGDTGSRPGLGRSRMPRSN